MSCRCGSPKARKSILKGCHLTCSIRRDTRTILYTFRLPDQILTGDTLFIRGTGRTDFQNGDPEAQHDSIFNKLLRLPDDTLVYPGHDYKGETVSTIAEERRFNPRLQVSNAAEYAEIMNGLNLASPKMMDVAVPANQKSARRKAMKRKRLGL